MIMDEITQLALGYLSVLGEILSLTGGAASVQVLGGLMPIFELNAIR